MRYAATVAPAWSLDAWRAAARAGLRGGVAPEAIDWPSDAQATLLPAAALSDAPVVKPAPSVPAAFVELAEAVLCHRDPQRYALLYRILWRLCHGERGLLERASDVDVNRALVLRKTVQRDVHKMKAFVRFRAVPGETDAYLAWFEPENFIVDRVAPFFLRRFAGMRWAIVTPYRRVSWDGETLLFGDGGRRDEAPADDASEELWRTYFAHIYNPARANPRMMQQEMPKRYWKHLPEARLIPELLNQSAASVEAMLTREAAAPRRRIPAPAPTAPTVAADTLDHLRDALKACRACELWQPATQAVAGEGPRDARTMLIGEQPGDREDLMGRPFVGPAGRLLDRALAELGIDRGTLFLTNAVKHFRFEQRGKMRLHKNPLRSHAEACSSWLGHELRLVAPTQIVCLGAVAAAAIFGTGFRLREQRGQWFDLGGGRRAMATVHPSWVLRLADAAEQGAAYDGFVRDLAMLCAPDDA